MAKLFILVFTTIGGGLGWWLGARVGTMTAFFLSIIGTAIGVIAGRWTAERILD